MLLYRYLDFPTVLLASLAVDVRALAVFLGVIEGPTHGLFHSFAGATLLSFLLIGAVTVVRPGAEQAMNRYLNIGQSPTDGSVVAAAFAGAFLHVIVDAFIYAEMSPLFPVSANPLFGLATPKQVYLFCIGSFSAGLLVYWMLSSGAYQKASSLVTKYGRD